MPAAHFKLFTPAKPRRFSPFQPVSARFGQFRAASGSFGQLRQFQPAPSRSKPFRHGSGMVPAWFWHGSGMVLAPPQLKHKKDKNHAEAELEKPNKAKLKSPQPMILVFLP